jgi:hypothetical protein
VSPTFEKTDSSTGWPYSARTSPEQRLECPAGHYGRPIPGRSARDGTDHERIDVNQAWFTEGFDIADLRDTKVLPDELRAQDALLDG